MDYWRKCNIHLQTREIESFSQQIFPKVLGNGLANGSINHYPIVGYTLENHEIDIA